VIRSQVVSAALICILAGMNSSGRGQSPDQDITTLGLRGFSPIYEARRPPPATDANGWPADWDQWPHLSLNVFNATSDFTATRNYRGGPIGYGGYPYGSPAQSPYAYGNGNYPPAYGNGPFVPPGYGGGWGSSNLFSSNSAFALQYGNPGSGNSGSGNPVSGPSLGIYSAPYGYPGFGPGYAFYPPPFGYGPYGWYPPQYGYGAAYWGGGPIGAPPGRFGPYFYW
jgi:hypothetical protein